MRKIQLSDGLGRPMSALNHFNIVVSALERLVGKRFKKCKKGGQKAPQITNKSTLGRPGAVQEALGTDFDRFRGAFGGDRFFMNFLICKKSANKRKNRRLWRQRAKFSEARRNARGRWEGIWGGFQNLAKVLCRIWLEI